MKVLLFLAIPLMLLASCFGNDVKEKMLEKVAVEYPEFLTGRLDDFPLMTVPYSVDSLFFEADTAIDFDNGNLNIETVKLLSANLATDDQSAREQYYLNDFYKIAQAKQDGTYDSLREDLDIGMTENAACKTIGRLEFGDTMALVIWEIKYKSYDACPYYTGHHVLGSLVKKGKVLACMQLASGESGADAPMSYETYQLVQILEKGEILLRMYSQTNEEDEVVEKEQYTAAYQIKGKGFSAVK